MAAARSSGRYDNQQGSHDCADAPGDKTLGIIAFLGRDGMDVLLVRLADGETIANYSTYDLAKEKNSTFELENESFELSSGSPTISVNIESRTSDGALVTRQSIFVRERARLVPVVAGLVTSEINGTTSIKRWIVPPSEPDSDRPPFLLVKELVNPGEGQDFIERIQKIEYDGVRYPVPKGMRIKP